MSCHSVTASYGTPVCELCLANRHIIMLCPATVVSSLLDVTSAILEKACFAVQDHSLRLWNLETQTCVCTMVGCAAHTNEVLSVVRVSAVKQCPNIREEFLMS